MFLKLNPEYLDFRLPRNGDVNLNSEPDILNNLDLKEMKTFEFIIWGI